MLPLDGVRVVEVGQSIAGSFAAKLLNAFGAEVIKVEPTHGDELRHLGPFAHGGHGLEDSLLFLYLNTGKQSVTLDVGSPSGRDLLTQLGKRADVVVESLHDDFDPLWQSLCERQIVTSIRNFGDGPKADYRGGELVLLALGGLLNMVGEPDREPVRLGGYQAQYTGGLSAFTGTLAALHEQTQSGLGQRVTISVLEAVAFVEWKSGIYYQADGRLRSRGGRDAQWLVLESADGFVAFVYQDEHWSAVKQLIDDARLEDRRLDSRGGRLAARRELTEILGAWTRPRTKHDIYHSAQALGIPVGIVADASDVLSSAQYAATGYFDEIDHPTTGPVAYAGTPCTFDGMRPRARRAPLLGEHNQRVYGELLRLGASDQERLHERGVI